VVERHSSTALQNGDAVRPRDRARAARARRAEETRERIVAAATRLFVENGYLDTTVSAVAKAAGVAVQTLYLGFGSKIALLEAALAAGAATGADPRRLDDVRAEPDGRAALALHVAVAAVAVDRHYPLAAVLRAAAADPEPAALLHRERAAALALHARAVDELADKPGFTDRLSLQRATEALAAVCSPETYGLLVVDHGWTAPDWQDWATRHAAADLFP
jgi:AcrR family transcriptional regulator